MNIKQRKISLSNRKLNHIHTRFIKLNFTEKNKQKILKIFLLKFFYQSFYDFFKDKLQLYFDNNLMECYAMDNKIIQFIIHSIVETGDYTLEGIAHYTQIPFDVLYDAACGLNNQFSITSWVRIVDLYLRVKPEICQMLTSELLDMKESNQSIFSLLK